MNHPQKRKLSTTPKKLIYFLLFLLPLSSFVFVKPEWAARLIAVAGCCGIGNMLLFISCLNFRAGFSVAAAPTHRKETEKERRDRNAPRVVKVLTIIFACLLFWFGTRPLVEDCVGLIRSGYSYLLKIDGTVENNQGVFGTRSVLQNFIIVERGNSSGESYSALFYTKIAKEGQTYTFTIAPKSRIVLEWESE